MNNVNGGASAPLCVYAGIGSRSAPADVLGFAEAAARRLSSLGWVLRSGHAPGMDQAFENGAGDGDVFLPWAGFELEARLLREGMGLGFHTRPSARAMEIAESFHPTWPSLKRPARLLHGRNSHILLGSDCDDPVKFVLCWTPNGKVGGGTGQALRIAAAYKIPVANLANEDVRRRWERFVAGDTLRVAVA